MSAAHLRLAICHVSPYYELLTMYRADEIFMTLAPEHDKPVAVFLNEERSAAGCKGEAGGGGVACSNNQRARKQSVG